MTTRSKLKSGDKVCYESCKNTKITDVIACDSGKCSIEWYHYKCVGVSGDNIPEGDWICPECQLTLPQGEEGATSDGMATNGDENEGKPDGTERRLDELRRKQRQLDIEIAEAQMAEKQEQLARLKCKKKNSKGDSQARKVTSQQEDILQELIEKMTAQLEDKSDDSEEEESEGKKTSGRKIKTSGLFRKTSDDVLRHQEWPHLNLKREYCGKNVGFHDLNMAQFVAGELEIIGACKAETERVARTDFLNTLMYDAVKCEWKYILEWYAAWVREIELGNKEWGEDFSRVGNNIMKHSTLSHVHDSPRGAYNDKSVWFCSNFNREQCNRDAPHRAKVKGVWRDVVHICAKCYIDSRAENFHSENSAECPLRAKGQK